MSKPQTTFSNLLNKLQGLNLKQTGYWVDDLPEDIYENFFYGTDYEVVARDLDENDSVGDASFVYQFFEMREKTVTSYEKVPGKCP